MVMGCFGALLGGILGGILVHMSWTLPESTDYELFWGLMGQLRQSVVIVFAGWLGGSLVGLFAGATVGISLEERRPMAPAGFVTRKRDLTHEAAEQGYSEAQYNLGNRYRQGKGVPEDYTEALKWYHKAAGQGHAHAQHNLASMHRIGIGVPRNDIEAYAWYSVAAATGHRYAKKSLAKAQLTPEQLATAEERAAELTEQINANKAK